jgi:hypothetical protein
MCAKEGNSLESPLLAIGTCVSGILRSLLVFDREVDEVTLASLM